MAVFWCNISVVVLTAIVVSDGIKNSGKNEGGLAHQLRLVQLSSEKNPAFRPSKNKLDVFSPGLFSKRRRAVLTIYYFYYFFFIGIL